MFNINSPPSELPYGSLFREDFGNNRTSRAKRAKKNEILLKIEPRARSARNFEILLKIEPRARSAPKFFWDPKILRAKRAKIFRGFWPLLGGKRSKNVQKMIDFAS